MKKLRDTVVEAICDMIPAAIFVTMITVAMAMIVYSIGTTVLYFSNAKIQHNDEQMRALVLVAEHEARIKKIHNDLEIELHTIEMSNLREKALFEQENILKKELIEAVRARDIAKLRAEEALYKEVYEGRGELDCRTIESNETVKLTCITYIDNDTHPNPDFKPIRNIN